MKTFRELNDLIIDWAKERELDTKGTVQGQKLKTIEELAELIIGISKDNKEIIKDSIGDVAVTLIIGNMLHEKHDMEEIYGLTFETGPYISLPDKLNMIKVLISSMNCVFEGGYNNVYIFITLQTLIQLSKCYDLEFLDCLESAYNEISNRKGKMIDGTFVKEQDL